MALININEERSSWEPVGVAERYTILDLLRGFALFGVLLVNLLYFFRISLFDHILNFNSHAGWVNHAIDLLVAEFVEFKAFDLFSLTFGVGVAIQAERARARGVIAEFFLLRRFLILLAFGAFHMVVVSNVDILSLYAVCGVLMIALIRMPALVLALAGLAAVYLPSVFGAWPPLPPFASWAARVADAAHIYRTGSFWTILEFRWRETQEMILPLVVGVAQKTFGLMLLGVALWRSGVVREPRRYRTLLWVICFGAGVVGLLNTTAEVMTAISGKRVRAAPFLELFGPHVPLAFAYAAALLAWKRSGRSEMFTAPVAAAGQMALTNYLMQSIVFALLFYGYGFQLFGRLDPQTAAPIGVGIYAGQLWFSVWWLKQYQFGPFEWLWRSLTYGSRQPMSRRLPYKRRARHQSTARSAIAFDHDSIRRDLPKHKNKGASSNAKAE